MPETESDEAKDWPSIPGGNRTNGKVLPEFHQKRHDAQQALLRGEDVPTDSGTDMIEQDIADILAKLTTPEARERFLRSFKESVIF